MFARTGFALVIFVLLGMVAACGGDSAISFGDSSDDPAAEPYSSTSFGLNDDAPDVAGETAGEHGDAMDADVDESGRAAQISTGDFQRRVIRSAELKLEVSDVRASVRHARELAEDYGGHVDSSSAQALGEGEQIAEMTLEVPSVDFERVLDALRDGPHVVEVEHESTSSRDVTEEFVDLTARLANLESTESRYVQLLDEAVSISEILDVENEITRVRGDIEQIKGRLNYLEQRTDYSRIHVAFQPVEEERVEIAGQHFTPGETAREAWNASMEFIGTIGNGVIAVGVFFWWGWPLVGMAIVGLLRYRRRKFEETAPAEA